jgi:ABC-type dipeptide/oligopeptide/nickel transport system permease component
VAGVGRYVLLVFVMVNLAADLLYAKVNPTVAYD